MDGGFSVISERSLAARWSFARDRKEIYASEPDALMEEPVASDTA